MKGILESICQLLPQSSLAFVEHDDVDHKNNASYNDDYDDFEYIVNRNSNNFIEFNDNKSITF